MKRSCIFIFIIISLGAIAQDNPELSGNITIDPSKIDWTKYEGSGAVSNPMDRLTDAPPLSDLNSMPRLEIQGNSDVHEVLRTLPDFNKMMGIRSRPFTVDYSNLGQSFSLSGVNSWGLRDCPYNLVFGDNSNLNDIMKGWTSGEQCFQQVTPRAPAADRIDSDVNACKCLVNNQNNLVAYAMANKTTAVENIGTLEQTVAYNTLRLQNMRSGLLLQASLLCNTPEEARNVNPLFNNMSTEMSGVLDTYVRNARSEIASEASNSENQNSPAIQTRMRELASKLEVPTADEKLLTKGFEQNANDCVSVKEYLAFNQLPAYNDFYNSLATESFDTQKWDIKILESDLNNVVEKGGIDSREYWKLRGRIKFLQKNGLWRAVFSASDSPENKQRKEDLFNIIKSSFGNSRCKADSCRLDLMSSRKYDDYREASRRFLGRKDIAEMINTSEVERAKVEFSEAAAHNIMKRPPLPSTLDAYRQYSARFNAHLSHCDDPKNASACMVAYAQHCPEINQIQQQLQNKTARFTDGDFELESMGNTEMDPDLNPAYQEFRDAMCGPRSSALQGTMANFGAFREHYCPANARSPKPECASGDQARRALVAKYIQTYPRPGSSRRNKVKNDDRAFASFLGELQQNNSDLSAADARTAASTSIPVGRVGEVSQRNLSNLGANNDFSYGARSSSRPELAGSRVASTPVAPSTASSAQTSTQTQPSGQSFSRGFVSPEMSSLNAANVVVPTSPKTETLRSQVQKSDTESQALRDQLTGLRSDIERENAKPAEDKNSGLVKSLSDRLADLERRLASKEQEGDDLRRKLRASEDSDRAKTASRSIASEDDQEARSRRSQDSFAPSTVTPSSQPQPAAPVASVTALGSTSGGQLGTPSLGGHTNSGTVRSVGGTSGGELLRAKYNIEPGSDQTAGIVIAQTSSGFNYQQLQADSAGNVITVPLSSAEFQNLPLSEQQQYMAQMDPNKSVYRFAFSDGERFLVRDGSQFQVVPVEASPDRAPASVPERSIRLEDLNNDLRTSR